MKSLEVPARLEPSFAAAVWRARWFVLILALVGAGAGAGYAAAKAKVYTAQATVAASASVPSLGSQSAGSAAGSNVQEDISNALVLLQSPDVASRAADIANGDLHRRAFTADAITSDLVVQQATTTSSSNASSAAAPSAGQAPALIQVQFSTGGPKLAAAGANAVLQAYEEARATIARSDAAAALANVNGSLTTVSSQIDTTRNQLAALETQLVQTNGQQQVLAQRILDQGLRAAPAPATPNASLDSLTSELTSLESRQNALLSQRDTIQGAEQLELAQPVGTVPATPPTKPSSPNRVKDILLGFALGLFLGALSAYPLALRRQRFRNRHEPAILYEAPLLGAVPSFALSRKEVRGGGDAKLPVTSRPDSPEAEAFRYVATALTSRIAGAERHAVVFASSRRDAGKTTLVANTALALAESGVRVLAVDADHLGRDLSRLLLAPESRDGDTSPVGSGPTQVGPRLSVVAVGPAKETLDGVVNDRSVDMILVDAPPLLESAYASELAVELGRVVMVLGHRERVRRQLEAPELLRRLGVEVVGYIYNRAPRTRELGAYYRPARNVMHQNGHGRPPQKTSALVVTEHRG